MFSISWDIEELKFITSECRKIHHELSYCLSACTDELFQEQNIPRKLTSIRPILCDLIKRIAHFRRTPATHVFILMVSSDAHDRKPYASPVQCLPYAGLKEKDVRRLVSDLCKTMVSLGMKVSGEHSTLGIIVSLLPTLIGFASDGEFNYLRAKGYTRPLSVLQIRCMIRNKYSKMSVRRMLEMIMPKHTFHYSWHIVLKVAAANRTTTRWYNNYGRQ